MIVGMNLGGVNYYTSEAPLIDRMLTASEVSTKFTTAAYDPVALLATGAGTVVRNVPLDPGTHDYVILFEGAVTGISGNGMVKPPVISGNRATFTATRADPKYDAQINVTASGPVTKISLMRADHEAAYLKGERFNPDFIAKVSPFKLIRTLDWDGTNRPSFPAQRPLMSGTYFQDDRGAFPLELGSLLCAQIGARRWAPLHHSMTDAQILDALPGMAVCDTYLEWGNEVWNSAMESGSAAFVRTATASRYNVAKPQPTDLIRYYGYRSGLLAKLAQRVSPRFKVVLCWQTSNGADSLIAAALAGWDESGAPRGMIAGYAVAPYINANRGDGTAQIIALMQANDAGGFVKLLDAKRAERVPWMQAIGASCKKAGLRFLGYEVNQSTIFRAPVVSDVAQRDALVAWTAPIVHSDPVAAIVMQSLRDLEAAGMEEVCFYQMTGAGSQYGEFGAMPHVSLSGYPIYDRLVAAVTPAATPVDSLTSIAADLSALAARLSAYTSLELKQ